MKPYYLEFGNAAVTVLKGVRNGFWLGIILDPTGKVLCMISGTGMWYKVYTGYLETTWNMKSRRWLDSLKAFNFNPLAELSIINVVTCHFVDIYGLHIIFI
jgi:hypothetical protein